MAAAVIVGAWVHGAATPETAKAFSTNIKLLSNVFLRLVQMIISPLVFTTLVVGIAKLGDIKTVGRVGGKAILWFLSASLASLLLGMFLVNLLHPGSYINLSEMDNDALKDLATAKQQGFSLAHFVEHVIPKSLFEALANNEMLQLVIFSVFFGVAAASIGDYAKPLIKALDIAAHIVLKIVGYVMNFAPFGVFGALSAVIAVKGLSIFQFYIIYFSYFLIGIALLWVLLLSVGYFILGKRLFQLMKR